MISRDVKGVSFFLGFVKSGCFLVPVFRESRPLADGFTDPLLLFVDLIFTFFGFLHAGTSGSGLGPDERNGDGIDSVASLALSHPATEQSMYSLTRIGMAISLMHTTRRDS